MQEFIVAIHTYLNTAGVGRVDDSFQKGREHLTLSPAST